MTSRPLTILIAPDSFKGSLTSVEVARALATGWSRARPDDTVVLSPLADGGEGTLESIAAAGGWTWQTADVRDPLGRRIPARWLRSTDGSRAVVEMAEASGLSRLRPEERDAMAATSIGTGELIRTAIDAGARHVTVGIGGSATTDGGKGLLDGLGGLDGELDPPSLDVACDVDNPLLGDRGAAAIYGPQKGASPSQVAELDARNARWADDLEQLTGRRERDTPGAGAAGGVGFALLAIQDQFASFALRPGVELLMEATGFDEKLATADLVITGEGRIDAQTAFGKTALGVAKRARAAGVPCIAVGGGVEPEGVEALSAVGAIAVPVTERPQTVEAAMAAGAAPLERCGERLAQRVEKTYLTKSWTKSTMADMGTTVNIHEAKTHLSRLLQRVQGGEEITIAKAGKPIARLTAIHDRPARRVPGNDKIVIHPNFDDPLPEWDPDYMHPEDPMRELIEE